MVRRRARAEPDPRRLIMRCDVFMEYRSCAVTGREFLFYAFLYARAVRSPLRTSWQRLREICSVEGVTQESATPPDSVSQLLAGHRTESNVRSRHSPIRRASHAANIRAAFFAETARVHRRPCVEGVIVDSDGETCFRNRAGWEEPWNLKRSESKNQRR
jgi:hypothetical protein